MEKAILLYLQAHRQEELTAFFKTVTHLGDYGAVWFLIAAVCFFMRLYRSVGIKVFIALGLVGILNNLLLKNIIDRERPFDAIAELQLLTAEPSGASFPSGHTAGALAAGYILYRYLPRRYGMTFLILGFVMGFSRIYVGAHYPTDVIGGIIIGCVCGYAADMIYKIIGKNT